MVVIAGQCGIIMNHNLIQVSVVVVVAYMQLQVSLCGGSQRPWNAFRNSNGRQGSFLTTQCLLCSIQQSVAHVMDGNWFEVFITKKRRSDKQGHGTWLALRGLINGAPVVTCLLELSLGGLNNCVVRAWLMLLGAQLNTFLSFTFDAESC